MRKERLCDGVTDQRGMRIPLDDPFVPRPALHAALVADSPVNANEERTFMVNKELIFVVNAGLRFVVNDGLTGARARIDPGKSAA